MRVCACVCVCVCVCVRARARVCVCACVCMDMHTHTYVDIIYGSVYVSEHFIKIVYRKYIHNHSSTKSLLMPGRPRIQ